jgi:dGTPase
MPGIEIRTSPTHAMRERQEAIEAAILHPRAARSVESRGRDESEPACPVRTEFQRDRDRVLHSKAFRRLKHKTQVFIAPEGDHYRTRLTHTLEVAQISRTVARALGLNEDLVEAIGLGHDLGHTPFGDAGEHVLDELCQPGGFRHNEQSLRVAQTLELMNLTWEVRDGIFHHTSSGTPTTLEGQIVKICDRVAYLNHDLEDAVRAGILREDELPPFIPRVFGPEKGDRIATIIRDLVTTSSADYEFIRMSEALHEPFLELQSFVVKRVYTGSRARVEEDKAMEVVARLYRHFRQDRAGLEAGLGRAILAEETPRAVADYISGMTDRSAMALYQRLFLPTF